MTNELFYPNHEMNLTNKNLNISRKRRTRGLSRSNFRILRCLVPEIFKCFSEALAFDFYFRHTRRLLSEPQRRHGQSFSPGIRLPEPSVARLLNKTAFSFVQSSVAIGVSLCPVLPLCSLVVLSRGALSWCSLVVLTYSPTLALNRLRRLNPKL
jgi:hypothetical protein